jgi:hypothetical protein
MASSKLTRFVVSAAAGVVLAGGLVSAALADGGQTHPQTHHCKMPDGTMDMKKTHKQCTAAKGTWFKDVPSPGAGSGSAAPAPSKPAPGAGSGSAAPAK